MHTNATVLRNRMLSRARFRHLLVLVRIADLGTVKRAAEAVGMSQPSTTQALADLEMLLDCKLFLRHTRGMALTAVGHALLPLARRTLELVEDSATRVAAMEGQVNSVLRVAAISAALSGLLVQAIPAFNRAHPEVLVLLEEASAARQAALLADAEIDLAICRAPPIIPQGWQFAPLQRDRFAVIAGHAHPLVGKRRIAFEDLLSATWLMMPTTVAARTAYDSLFADAPASPESYGVITGAPTMVWSLLIREPLLALLPVSLVRPLLDSGQLVELPFERNMPFNDIGLLRPIGDAHPATEKLVAFLLRCQSTKP